MLKFVLLFLIYAYLNHYTYLKNKNIKLNMYTP